MMGKRAIGPLMFTLLSVVGLFWLLSDTPRVLVLHSYSPTYSWTSNLEHFLDIGFKKRQHLRHQTYYMNSKTRYDSKIEKSTLRAIDEFSPDLIIAFDDNAQKLLSKYYHNLPKDVKIVFAGVNGYVKKYNYNDKKNVTGVFERKPVLGVLFALSNFNQLNDTEDYKSVVFLTDNSTSSKIDAEILSKEDWQDFKFSTHSVNSFAEWKRYVLSLDKKQVQYLLLAGYRKLRVGVNADEEFVYASFRDVAQWTQENSPVQIIALNTFSAIDGFAFAMGSAPSEQVHVALEMMDEILQKGVEPNQIPYRYPNNYDVAINKTAAEQFQYEIPLFFESFAESSDHVYTSDSTEY